MIVRLAIQVANSSPCGGETLNMHTIALRLHPGQLANPDTDLCHVLPDLLIERSGGVLIDAGWGYEGEPPFMVLFLQTHDLKVGLDCVLGVVETVRVRGNDLRQGCVVAVRQDIAAQGGDPYQGYEVVYPPGVTGPFAPWVG